MIRETSKYLSLKEDEPPPKKLITEGDILIKNLAQKQLNTNITLQNYLNNEKVFEKVSEHIPLTSCHSGESTLNNFKDMIDKVENIEYLRSAGLTNDDIKLLWDYNNKNDFYSKHKKVEKSILNDKIEKILKILKESHSQVTEQEIKSRSLNDEMLMAAKPNSTTTKLLKFAMENEKDERKVFKSSMDDLKDIAKDRFSYLDDEVLNSKKVQKRIRNINNRINNIGKKPIEDNKNLNVTNQFVEQTKWDSKEIEHFVENKNEKKIFTCKPKNYYTIRNGEIVQLNNKEIEEKGLEISKHKLSVEEIKKLPRFENYTPGVPTNILFIKNLPKCIKEGDLKEIFDFKNVIFKVMSGRMKGQVFATFTDSNEATLALNKFNGLLINNKPMVIEYGKSGKNQTI